MTKPYIKLQIQMPGFVNLKTDSHLSLISNLPVQLIIQYYPYFPLLSKTVQVLQRVTQRIFTSGRLSNCVFNQQNCRAIYRTREAAGVWLAG